MKTLYDVGFSQLNGILILFLQPGSMKGEPGPVCVPAKAAPHVDTPPFTHCVMLEQLVKLVRSNHIISLLDPFNMV